MVHEIRGMPSKQATGAGDGSAELGAAFSADAGLRGGSSGRQGSSWNGAEFERRRAMLERMIEAKAEPGEPKHEDARAGSDEPRNDDAAEPGVVGDGDGVLHPAHHPLAAASDVAPARDVRQPAEPEIPRDFSAIERLVRDFHLRDPLLAAHRVSCRLDFGDAFRVTAELGGTAKDIEIRFDVTSELFALKTGCPVGMMADALRARFPDLRIRVVFAPAPAGERDEEKEA